MTGTEMRLAAQFAKMFAKEIAERHFPVGAAVDSRLILLFAKLNLGVVTAVHPDGMVMVEWDLEGRSLHYPSELRRLVSLWDHLKETSSP
jgi:hypothetical protein